ncbi:MAG: flagellar hook-basal body complex protein FliE [Planctomycetota bacterium]
MVDGIGGTGAGRAAIEAALKRMRAHADEIGAAPNSPTGVEPKEGDGGFAAALREGIGAVDDKVQRTNAIHVDVVEGRLDLHEVTAQLKESEISFQFALQVRNKLIDAYREVMRMSV